MSCVGKIRTTHAVLSDRKRKRGWMAAHLHSKAAPTNSALEAPSFESLAMCLAFPTPASTVLPQVNAELPQLDQQPSSRNPGAPHPL